MLDVHPPHAPTHTWKDFLLHIATITVGLLIAIGLEQTVELFHHRHQRHQLEEQLRAETLYNMNVTLQNLDAFSVLQAGILARYNELQTAAREHRSPRALPPPTGPSNVYPTNSAWLVAQQSATVGLLPVAESELYVRVYRTNDRVTTSMIDEYTTREGLNAAELPGRVFDPVNPQASTAPVYDLSRMTPDELRVLGERLATNYVSIANCIFRNRQLYTLDWEAWYGHTSEDELQRAAKDAKNIPGGKAGVLGRYPLPEEAKRLASADGDR